ncbi:MAG: mandelate racemase/muconate lactonizing enzyme family protein [Chloroflexi bacterium]|nr:mandelate racemase/muconate lactonizing enzyme family protein [Chloroflexota bacterium]
MKIKDIETTPMVLVKDDPKWKTALSASPVGEGTVLKINTGASITGLGFASANPPYDGVKPPILKAVFQSYGRYLAGKDPYDIAKILLDLEQMPLSEIPAGDPADRINAGISARSAIDMALHDIMARAAGLPVYQLLGGLVRDEIPVLRMLGIKEPAEMAENALRLTREGYRYLKIKLEGHPAEDLARVRAIREAVGADIHLTTDPNQSYSADAAIESIKQMEPYRIEMVEQPVPEDDFAGLVRVSRNVNCLIEAHESAKTAENVFRLVKDGFAGCVSIGVTHGGLREAKRVADICRLGKLKCLVACVGPSILSAAAMHFIASTINIGYACQLAEFSRFVNDPFRGVEIKNGAMRVPGAPGLGVGLAM